MGDGYTEYGTTVIVSVFTAIGFIAVVVRYTVRCAMLKQSGIEEIFIGTSMLLSAASAFCKIQEIQYEVGQQTPEKIEYSLQYLFASILTYNLCLCFTKLAILLLYHRVFLFHRTRLVSKWLILFVVLYAVAMLFSSIFTCVPVQASWNFQLLNGLKDGASCVDRYALYFANAALNIASDVAIIILPIPAIRALPIPRSQKISVIGILILGGFVCVVSGLRLHTLISMSKATMPTTSQRYAVTCWSAIELNIGIVCACLPTLRPLMNRLLVICLGTRPRRRGIRDRYNDVERLTPLPTSSVDNSTSALGTSADDVAHHMNITAATWDGDGKQLPSHIASASLELVERNEIPFSVNRTSPATP